MQKPQPIIDPGSAPYWEALKAGRLMLPWCCDCAKPHFYPRELCPHCHSDRMEWKEASGDGKIYTFTLVHRSAGPAFADEVPYAVALINLVEGPRMMTRILGDARAVAIGQRVRLKLQAETDGATLPYFVIVAD